jgi:subtilisin family serine protease
MKMLLIRCRKRLLAAAFLAAALAVGSAGFAADTNKISSMVRLHQKLKIQPPGKSLAQHKKDLQAQGMSTNQLDRERVAFYVTRPLTTNEIQEFAARGIVIHLDNWVPPVSGKHPYGYYLAEVPFSELEKLEQDERVARIETTEIPNKHLDNVARAVTHVDVVQAGTGFTTPRNGAGVRVAIADDYLDLTHADFTNNPPFEKYDVTSGTGTTNWSTNVSGPGYHGTHVSGIIVGSGTNSGGLYRGVAPGAQWAFYRLADSSGNLTDDSIVKAVNRAAAANCKIFTLSVGGYAGHFMDGSDPADQAVDAAVSSGVTVFVAAGNEGNTSIHDSASPAPGGSSTLGLSVVNNSGNSSVTVYLYLLWREAVPGANLTLIGTNLTGGDSLAFGLSDQSARNTSRLYYILTAAVPNGGSKTYYLKLQNSAGSTATPTVQFYSYAAVSGATATFTSPDVSYVVTSPADADGAIAVGAYVHRTTWTACSGLGYMVNGETLNTIATFSSRGPRIDGLQKPDVIAPGAMTFSAMSSTVSLPANEQIPNNANGGCTYLALAGTSMACPHAAGIGALILQAQPGLSPAEVRTLMTTTASQPAAEDNTWGWGLLNASNAVHFAELNQPGVWVNYGFGGTQQGTAGQPFSTTTAAVTHAPSAGTIIVPRIRISAVNTTEALSISNTAVRIEPYGGNVRIAAP